MSGIIRNFAPVLLVLAASGSAYGQGCTNNDFKGTYSAIATGNFISPPPGVPAGPTARVGRVQLDGNGIASIKATLSLSGFILEEIYGGTYKINADCTASFILLVPFPGAPAPVPFEFNGMLVNEGRAMNLILVSPQGTDVRIVLTKQRKPACTNGDLNGDYALNMSGVQLSGVFVPQGPFARVGKVSFDGAGGFKSNVQSSYAGRIFAESFNGTYSMSPDCTFTANFTATVPSSWFGVLADTMSGANVIQSNPGTVITGTLISAH